MYLRKLLCIFVFCLLCSSVLAFDGLVIERSGVDFTGGYRSDQLKWSIAGDRDGQTPNILSELDWEDIEIFQLSAQGWIETERIPYLDKKTFFLTRFSIGKILDGDVRDSDYAGNNRTKEWSRSVNHADSGVVVDLSGAWGPQIKFAAIDNFILTPLVGYGFNMQALSMSDGRQVISDSSLTSPGHSAPHPQRRIAGLDSSYTAYWHGPWVGLNGAYNLNDRFVLLTGIEYHLVNLFAQADWNLRSEFEHPVSFEHEARGTGLVWTFTCEYLVDQRWSLLFNGRIQDWKTESGIDRTYFADGSKGVSRLNRVEWNSYELMSGIQYRF